MKKYILATILLCTVVAASGCTMQGTGSGKIINQTKDIAGVNQISLNGIGTLIIQQGNQESLTIQAEDNIVPHIRSNVNVNKLDLSYDTNTPTPTKDVKFYLTVKDLNTISLSGAGKVESSGLKTNILTVTTNGVGECNMTGLDLSKLIVNLSGAGKMFMAGKTSEQTITISGAGEYLARELQSKTTTLTINGAGKGTVNVSTILNAIINGSGEISYLGNPQVSQQINGAGSIKQITT
ncbi:MAG: head GIN domain-containing protein [Methanobacteriaceae archaeon]|nr:head GIN domain-containing protein [Methanobacteriaceae archaeon]